MCWSISASVATSAQIAVSGGVRFSGGQSIDPPTVVLTITDTSPLPNCTIGTNFSYTFNVTGGVQPYAWSLFSGSLQPGLSLSAGGVLSGQCSNSSGTVTFTVQVADSAGNSTTKTFQQTAQNTPPGPLTVNTSVLPSVVQQSYYGQNLNASGGFPPYTWAITVGSLPPGLTLNVSTGFITGFPSTVGTFNFTVQVTDTVPTSATAALSIQVLAQGSGPTTASEPINWVNSNQGGCSSHSGTCSHPNLPALCTAGNLCLHKQLGFGTNDHPATIAGLQAANSDWLAAGSNWYLWAEVKPGTIHCNQPFDANSSCYSTPVKATPGTGYFVITGECDPGGTNVPCTALQSRVPCFHGFTDTALTYTPLCGNDLPSMWSIMMDGVETAGGVGGNSAITMVGSNVVLNDFEATLAPGSNQDASNATCLSGQVCADVVNLFNFNCQHCVARNGWIHGWDPGDPGQPTSIYPASPSGQHPCPSWAYYSTEPPSNSNPTANVPSQFANGCGDAVQKGLDFSCVDCGLEHILISKVHRFQNESHAIGGGGGISGVGNGPYKMVDVVVMGGSQPIILGGFPLDPTAGVAADLEFRRVRFMQDPGYRLLTGGSGHSPGPPAAGCNNNNSGNRCPFRFAEKKDFECKFCQRLLVDGFIMENMWPDGQTGEIMVVDPRVCSGGSDCGIFDGSMVPLTVANNVRFTNGIIRNASGGWGMSARSGQPGDGGGQSQGAQYHLLKNVAIYNLDQIQFGGNNGGNAINYGAGAAIKFTCKATRTSGQSKLACDIPLINPKPFSHIDIGQTAASGTLTIGLNGQREDPYNGGAVTIGCDKGGVNCEGTLSGGLAFTNLLTHGTDCTTLPCTTNSSGTYKPICGGGIGVSTGFQVGASCSNCGVGANQACPKLGCTTVGCGSPFPDITVCDKTGTNVGIDPPQCGPANASFPSWAFAVHDISPGDILHIYNASDASCANNGFTTPLQPQLSQVLADNSTNPGSLTLTWAQALPDVGSGAGVTCMMDNASGWQSDFIAQHVAIYTGGLAKLFIKTNSVNAQPRRHQFIDSIFYFGGTGKGSDCSSHSGEGNSGFYDCFDRTTLQFHHLAFINRGATASKYTAVGQTGSVICPSGVTPGNCQVPVVTCPGATVTSTSGVPDCAGLSGFMSGNAFPSTDCSNFDISTCPLVSPPWGSFDYHKLALCGTPGATACAGGNPMATMATDGTMLGPDFVKIDNAFTRTEYVCEGPCGAGPYPD